MPVSYTHLAVKNQMAYVPDELYFLSGSSMDRMAGLYAAIYPRFDRERYRSLTAAFRLDPRKSLNTFSKGMRRQAATILAVSTRPQYISSTRPSTAWIRSCATSSKT